MVVIEMFIVRRPLLCFKSLVTYSSVPTYALSVHSGWVL